MPHKYFKNNYGEEDFTIDDFLITQHAIQRARERRIPLEDLRRLKGKVGDAVIVGNTVVTVIPKRQIKPDNEVGEIVHTNPKVIKIENKFIGKLACPHRLIPCIIGTKKCRINKLSSYIKGKISWDRDIDKFRIESDILEDTIFMIDFIKFLIECHRNKDINTRYYFEKFIINRIELPEEDKIKLEKDYEVTIEQRDDAVYIVTKREKKMIKILEILNEIKGLENHVKTVYTREQNYEGDNIPKVPLVYETEFLDDVEYKDENNENDMKNLFEKSTNVNNPNKSYNQE